MSSEHVNFPFRRVIAPLLALSIGIVGCSIDSSPSENPGQSNTTEVHESADSIKDINISTTYTPTGKRITDYLVPGNHVFSSSVISYCDGYDLVDITLSRNGTGSSSSIERSPDHTACNDGKLTPSDFVIHRK